MTAILRIGGALAADEDGATAIEYALLAAMIADGDPDRPWLARDDRGRLFTTANADLITYMPAGAP